MLKPPVRVLFLIAIAGAMFGGASAVYAEAESTGASSPAQQVSDDVIQTEKYCNDYMYEHKDGWHSGDFNFIFENRANHIVSVTDDGRLVFAGGLYDVPRIPEIEALTIAVANLAEQRWCRVLPLYNRPTLGSAVDLGNGQVFMVGLDPDVQRGTRRGAHRSAAMIFDAKSGGFRVAAAPGIIRRDPAMIRLDDGRVLSVGGYSATEQNEDGDQTFVHGVEIYDPRSDTWTPASPVGRELRVTDPYTSDTHEYGYLYGQHFLYTHEPFWLLPLSDNRAVLSRLGWVSDQASGERNYQNVIEIYDATADTWQLVSHVETKQLDSPHAVAITSSEEVILLYEYRVETISLANGERKTSCAPQSVPRGASFTELPDGSILLAGGIPGPHFYWSETQTWILDPLSGSWRSGPPLAESRAYHSATLLPDDILFLYGGKIFHPYYPNSVGSPLNGLERVRLRDSEWVNAFNAPPLNPGLRDFPFLPCTDILEAVEMEFTDLNYIGIVGAAVVSFVLGALWFSPLVFGKFWMRANGFPDDDPGAPPVAFVAAFLLMLIASYVLSEVIGANSDALEGLRAGLAIGAAFVAAAIGVLYLFERRPPSHFLVNAGYMVVTFSVMGVIIGATS